MLNLSRQIASLALLLLMIWAGCGQGTYVAVRIEPAVPLAGVTRIDLELELQGRTEPASIQPGGEISLPTSIDIDIGHGEGPLQITAVARGRDGGELARGSGSAQVAAGQTSSLTLTLGPSQGPSGPPPAAGPALVMTPAQDDLGSVVQGQPGGEYVFTVRNTGDLSSGTLKAALSGPDAQNFALSADGCTDQRLGAKEACTLKVRLTPSSPGPKTATLTVSADPGGAPSAALSGTGLAPSSLQIGPVSGKDFGTQDVGAQGPGATLTVTNTGGSATGPLGTQVSSADSFSIGMNGCAGQALGPGKSCQLQVQFAPISWGPKNATLQVSGTPGGVVTAALSGTGRDRVPLTVVVNGGGTVTAPAGTSGKGINCPGTCTESYERTTAAPTVQLTAAPGAGSTFGSWSGPGCAGSATTCAVVLDAAATVTATFRTGPALKVTPASQDLGQVTLGGTAEAEFQVSNGGGSDAAVPSVVLSGADFTISSNGCLSALPAGGSCTVKVKLQPTAVGGRSATLTVSGNPGGTVQASLSGTGTRYVWSLGYSGIGGYKSPALATDSQGNLLVAGAFHGSMDWGGGTIEKYGAYDIFVAKYSANGTPLWCKTFGASGDDVAYGVAVDGGSGEVIVVGSFQGTVGFGGTTLMSSGTNPDIFVARLRPSDGTPLWAKRYGGPGDDAAKAVAVDGDGSLIVTGYSNDAADFGTGTLASLGDYDIFVAKYGAGGNPVWAKRYGGGSMEQATAVAVDRNHNVSVVGAFYTGTNLGCGAVTGSDSSDGFVVQYSSSGTCQWYRVLGGPQNDIASAVAVDAGGDVYVAGSIRDVANLGGTPIGTNGWMDAFVAKFGPNGGAPIWAKGFGGPTFNAAAGVAVGRAGDVIITGYFNDPVDFGGGPIKSAGFADIFVAKFDPMGRHVWSQGFGGSDTDSGNAVAVDGSGNALVGGFFQDTVDFGGGPGGPVQLSGNTSIFLLKLTP